MLSLEPQDQECKRGIFKNPEEGECQVSSFSFQFAWISFSAVRSGMTTTAELNVTPTPLRKTMKSIWKRKMDCNGVASLCAAHLRNWWWSPVRQELNCNLKRRNPIVATIVVAVARLFDPGKVIMIFVSHAIGICRGVCKFVSKKEIVWQSRVPDTTGRKALIGAFAFMRVQTASFPSHLVHSGSAFSGSSKIGFARFKFAVANEIHHAGRAVKFGLSHDSSWSLPEMNVSSVVCTATRDAPRICALKEFFHWRLQRIRDALLKSWMTGSSTVGQIGVDRNFAVHAGENVKEVGIKVR